MCCYMILSNVWDSNYSKQDSDITMKLSVKMCLCLFLYSFFIGENEN